MERISVQFVHILHPLCHWIANWNYSCNFYYQQEENLIFQRGFTWNHWIKEYQPAFKKVDFYVYFKHCAVCQTSKMRIWCTFLNELHYNVTKIAKLEILYCQSNWIIALTEKEIVEQRALSSFYSWKNNMLKKLLVKIKHGWIN